MSSAVCAMFTSYSNRCFRAYSVKLLVLSLQLNTYNIMSTCIMCGWSDLSMLNPWLMFVQQITQNICAVLKRLEAYFMVLKQHIKYSYIIIWLICESHAGHCNWVHLPLKLTIYEMSNCHHKPTSSSHAALLGKCQSIAGKFQSFFCRLPS